MISHRQFGDKYLSYLCLAVSIETQVDSYG
jgi:hypothetical protein